MHHAGLPCTRATMGRWLDARLPWLVTALAALSAAQPLTYGLPRGHDTLLHLYRVPVLGALWRQGILFARWMPDLMGGYGYPLFAFYPPLSAYLITLLDGLVGSNAPLAMRIAFVLAQGLAGGATYLLARELYGSSAGVFSAVAYVFSPHLLYNTYARGSISSAVALGLYPLVIWAVLRLARRPGPGALAVAGLVLAALMLSHVATGLVIIGPLAIIGLMASLVLPRPEHMRRSIAFIAAGLTLGLVLSAFFWLPALIEHGSTHYLNAVNAPDADCSLHFAQVLSLPALPIAGLRDAPLPLTAGVGQLALAILGLGLSGAALVRARLRHMAVSHVDLLTVTVGLLGLAAVIVSTSLSAPLWEASGLVRRLQYPWRLLDAATPLLVLAAGRAVMALSARRWASLALLPALVLVVANALPYMYPAYLDVLPSHPGLEEVSEYELTSGALGLTSWGEYLPLTASREIPSGVPSDIQGVGLSLNEKVWLPDGVTLITSSGGQLSARLELEADHAATVRFATFWFAGWAADRDGEAAAIGPDEQGLLSVTVPPGRHTLYVHWARTPPRAVAGGLSIGGLALLAALLLFARRMSTGTRTLDRTHSHAVSNYSSATVVGVGIAMLFFGVFKGSVLDRVDTTLVRHAQGSCPSATTCVPWGTFENQVRLLAYEMGDDSSIIVYWQALETPETDYAVEVYAADPTGAQVLTLHRSHPSFLPTSQWSPGDLVWDRYQWPAPSSALPVAYQISAAMIDPHSGVAAPISDAPDPAARAVPLSVARYPAVAGPSLPDERAVDATYGDALRLSGISLPARAVTGQSLNYTLRWETLATVAEDYAVFVHLVDEAGELVADDDGQPIEGLYPTSLWAPGETVMDRRVWALDVPPGEYTVLVGFYSLSAGERLPVSGPDARLPDSIAVGCLTVSDGTVSGGQSAPAE